MNKKNNDTINKFLLVSDKFMPELHLYEPKIGKDSACGSFTKHKQRIGQFMKDGRLSHIYKNELDKACFQHDIAYNKYKDLKRRTQSDIVLKNKAYKIAVNPKYDRFQTALASIVWKFFNEKSKKVLSGSGLENEELADELHKPIIKKFKRRKLYSSFKDNIWGVDLADMTLLSTFNKRTKYLLCVIDLFSRYPWVVGLKDNNRASIVNGFQSIFKKSNRKPNKIRIDHGSEFYNNAFKKFEKENDINMYSTHNEGKSVVAERLLKL